MPKRMDAVAHHYYIAIHNRMSNKSKIKGKSWERDVANFLTKLYNEPFLRVPNSGAFVGGYNIYRTQTMTEQQVRSFIGDIIPGPSFKNLVIECKNYKEFPFHKLVFGQEIKQLDEWIKQAQRSCEKGDKWLLCIKVTHKVSFVVWDFDKVQCPSAGEYKEYQYNEYSNYWDENFNEVKEACKTTYSPD